MQSKCVWTFDKSLLQTKIKQNSRVRFCASLRNRDAHGQTTRVNFCENLPKKTAGNHPDQTPAFTPTTVTTPQCGHTVWGITGQVSEKKRRKTKPTNLPSQRARAHRRFNAHRCEKNMVTWFENAQNAMNKIGWLTRATGYLTGLTKHTSVLECKAVSCHHSCNQKCVGVE